MTKTESLIFHNCEYAILTIKIIQQILNKFTVITTKYTLKIWLQICHFQILEKKT